MKNSLLLGLLLFFSVTVSAQQTSATIQTPKEATFSYEGSMLYVSIERNKTRYPLSQIPKLHKGDTVIVEFPSNVDRNFILGAAFIPRPGQKPSIEFKKLSDGTANLKFSVTDPESKLLFFLAPSISIYDNSIETIRKAIEMNSSQLRKSTTDLTEASKAISAIDQILGNILTAQTATTRADALRTLGQDFGYTVSNKCISQDAISRKCAVTDFLANVKLDKVDNLNKAVVDTFINYLPPQAGSTVQLVAALIYFFQASGSDYEYLYSVGYISPDSKTRSKVELMLSKALQLSGKTVSVQVWAPAFEDEETPPALAFSPPAVCIAGNLEVSDKNAATTIFSKPYVTEWKLTLYSENKFVQKYELIPNPTNTSLFVKGGDSILPSLASWAGKRMKGEVSFKWAGEELAPVPVSVVIPDTAANIASSLKPAVAVEKEGLTLTFDSAAASCIQSLAIARNPQAIQAKIAMSVDSVTATFDESVLPAGAQNMILNVVGDPKAAIIPLEVASEVPSIKNIVAYSADSSIKVQGMRLDRIASLTLDGQKFMPVEGSWKLSSDDLDSVQNLELRASGAIGTASAKTATLAFTGDVPAARQIPIIVHDPRPTAKVISSRIMGRDASLNNWSVWTWAGAAPPLLPVSASALVDFSPDPPTKAFSTKARLVIQREDASDQKEIIPESISADRLRARVSLPSSIKDSFNGGGNFSYFIRDNNVDGNPRNLPFTFVRLPVITSPLKCDATGAYAVMVSNPYIVESLGTSESDLSQPDSCADQSGCLKVSGTISGKLFGIVSDARDQVLSIAVSAPTCTAQGASP
jgi:hypothetical protein